MVSVASLLNPVDEDRRGYPNAFPTRYESDSSSLNSPPPVKKQKMTKDAAVFSRGKVQGEIRYPPCDVLDQKVITELQKYSAYPIGKISEFRRHIPYNSDKKTFMEKTGRVAFEVFQYTFKFPNGDRQYTVMWDYNIGLVRITPFFKCCQYAKTVPAKMLNSNPGLREICHSITGGALAAQGYWMPFEAAKAVAATFCYDIRYVLTPLFGPEFVSSCIKPGSEGYGQMVIDPETVRHCAEMANKYKEMYSRGSSEVTTLKSPSSLRTTSTANWATNSIQSRHPQALDMESGYYTDTDRSDQYLPSPQSSNPWTRETLPKPHVPRFHLPSPQELLKNSNCVAGCVAPANSLDSTSGKVTQEKKRVCKNEGQESDTASSQCSNEETTSSVAPRSPITSTQETRAAYVLMQLHFADTSLKENESRAKKRRASS